MVSGDQNHQGPKQELIWLSQSAYIDKIINLAKSTQPDDTPMSREELIPYEDRAPYNEVNLYQRKIGSLLYAAVRCSMVLGFNYFFKYAYLPAWKHYKSTV